MKEIKLEIEELEGRIAPQLCLLGQGNNPNVGFDSDGGLFLFNPHFGLSSGGNSMPSHALNGLAKAAGGCP